MKALWQQISSVEITRIYCNTNFDAVVLDLEHGVFNNEPLFSLIQLINASNKLSFVRVTEPIKSQIRLLLDSNVSGIIFSKRSTLTLAATAVVSGLLLMVAHLNWLDPEITNLVPVLDSYWLMIHVAIITASYGFFSLASILGLIALWIIIFTNSKNKSKLKNTLSELTIINEKSLEIGLFMLTVGTFLGGVWANESWGRYWGWDPKETWALVSVLVYTFVLHMRFIPSLRDKLTFNIVSMFAIWTIIMTYFGVNYYLSGLHSYAAGDPMPIPSFVYYLSALMFVSAIISKLRFKRYYS